MIVPKLSRYVIAQLLKDGTPHPYCWISDDCYSPEEGVAQFLELGFIRPPNAQEVFLVSDLDTEAEHYVQATYGWSCKKICKPKKEI